MMIDLTMKPTSETNFMECLRELCGQNDVFRTKFGQYLSYKVRLPQFILVLSPISFSAGFEFVSI
jgi:hypothetical protein